MDRVHVDTAKDEPMPGDTGSWRGREGEGGGEREEEKVGSGTPNHKNSILHVRLTNPEFVIDEKHLIQYTARVVLLLIDLKECLRNESTECR